MPSYELTAVEQEALQRIDSASDLSVLEDIRIAYLGKKGQISHHLQQLGSLPPEERKALGATANAIKERLTDAITTKKQALEAAALQEALAKETVDVTLPVRPCTVGSLHPISQVIEECVAIFGAMGFEMKEGPDIEDDFHNFTALNVPEHHPARQMQDTFYLQATDAAGKPLLLRTQTSSVQIRAMKGHTPPFKFISAGRVYRSDSDMTHTPMFHQLEGVYIDKHVHMGHLKGCLEEFLQVFFGQKNIPVRFRPSFFPFTEPSAEVDIGCLREKDRVQIGAGKDWLEILGCGMVHPEVLRTVGVDPDTYQGFAFGMGIERLVMLKYGVPDIRACFESDKRWLSHYGFTVPHLGVGQ